MKTERDLTHVKQIPIDMEMLTAILTADGYAKVQAAIKVANSAHNQAVEAAAIFAEELVAQLCPANDHHSPREIADRIRGKLLRAP